MTYVNLDVISTTPFGGNISSILGQIDSRMLSLGNGSPVGIFAPNQAGIFYFDTNTPFSTSTGLWLCTSTDGTAGGTTWENLVFSFSTATTSTAGLVELATDAEVAAGTDTSRAVTPQGAASVYARSGANTDITSLSGLTTGISVTDGGTGLTSAGAADNLLVSTGSGWTSSNLFGAGADGGQITGNTVLTLSSATRYTVINSPTISLPAVTSANNGLKMSFKNIGVGTITWNVTGGANVENHATYSDSNYVASGFPCTDLQVRNGAWWVV